MATQIAPDEIGRPGVVLHTRPLPRIAIRSILVLNCHMGRLTLAVAALIFSSGLAQAQTFKGYPCTEDCSGHEAGYEWAERKGIADESDCNGNSNSFNEGCQAWVEENEPSSSSDEDQSGEEEE